MTNPIISILTPTWNRAAYLSDLWEALQGQTYGEFEWIVANDGSTDNTLETIEGLAGHSRFPVVLVNASTRVGKSRIDNASVAVARGDFILWCDSDDTLMPNALEELLQAWRSIPPQEREEFCGVTALCETETGVLGKRYPKATHTDLPLCDLLNMMQSDLVIFTRADLLKLHPFPEVDFLIPESSVWCQIGEKKTRFVPRVLEKKRYGEKDCLSFSGRMEYNRGRALALALTKDSAQKRLSRKGRVFRSINYIRYCLHGEVSVREALRNWGGGLPEFFGLLVLSPLALGLAFKDQLAGKVRWTHREFLDAQRSARIESRIVNQ